MTVTDPAAAMPRSAGRPRVDRAGPADRAFLAMARSTLPQQFAVALLFPDADGPDLATVRRLIDERTRPIRRLRQRLVPVPIGCGGPVWVDDPSFAIDRHVRWVHCREPGDQAALLDSLTAVVSDPLPRDAPLWSAALIGGLVGRGAALVIVLHHVLADGVGGLAVLATLVDGAGRSGSLGAKSVDPGFPRPRPTWGELVRDSAGRRWRGMRRIGRWWHDLTAAMAAGGGLRPAAAQRCSLVVGGGSALRMGVVRVEMDPVRRVAHRCGATVNDAVLVAVAAALDHVLRGRGERVDRFSIAVPVSGRSPDRAASMGNIVTPLLVSVPVRGDLQRRLRFVAAQVAEQRRGAMGPPPIAVLGGFFRLFAAVGGYRCYMRHQHRVHTLVSHVRGPTGPVRIAGHPVRQMVPIGVGEAGNMTVSFDVLSYAGGLTISAVVDSEHFPDLETLIDGLRTEFDLIGRAVR